MLAESHSPSLCQLPVGAHLIAFLELKAWWQQSDRQQHVKPLHAVAAAVLLYRFSQPHAVHSALHGLGRHQRCEGGSHASPAQRQQKHRPPAVILHELHLLGRKLRTQPLSCWSLPEGPCASARAAAEQSSQSNRLGGARQRWGHGPGRAKAEQATKSFPHCPGTPLEFLQHGRLLLSAHGALNGGFGSRALRRRCTEFQKHWT